MVPNPEKACKTLHGCNTRRELSIATCISTDICTHLANTSLVRNRMVATGQ